MDENDGYIKNIQDDIGNSSSTPDEDTSKAASTLYKDRLAAANLHNFEQNQIARTKYSHRIFLITCGWLTSVLLIVVADGLKRLNLSDAVLLALLGTTTVNALAFFLIVTQYLFNKKNST